MIDMIVDTVMIVGIVLVSVPVLFFAVVAVTHIVWGAYTLFIED